MTQKQPYRSTMPPPGMGRRGPMGRGMPVEKPKEGKKTLRTLIRYFQASAIDKVVSGDYAAVPALLVRMIAVYLFYALMTLSQGYLSASLSRRVVKNLRGELFRKIVNLPIAYTDHHSHGDKKHRAEKILDPADQVFYPLCLDSSRKQRPRKERSERG